MNFFADEQEETRHGAATVIPIRFEKIAFLTCVTRVFG